MATYGLNPNGLLDTEAELRGVTQSIDNATDELNAVVQVFIDRNEGDAKASFVDAQRRWEAGIAQMKEALAQGAVSINDIHNAYRLGDVRGASLFGGGV
jgi:uncharacterized protein YukE